MKLQKPENNNYCATVVAIKNIIVLPNCDNVVATTIFGFQAIVSKDVKVGDVGIVFSAETQLSDEYCSQNNLYRHSDKNSDQGKKGYLEDNRRVKAVKFRGNTSSALFMPLSSVDQWLKKGDVLKEGDEFDKLYDVEICKKYIVPIWAGTRKNAQSMPKAFKRVDTKFIPEHFATDNYFRNSHVVPPEAEIVVTQKIHGTSIRIANTIVKRKKTLRDRFAELFGVKVQEYEFDYVYGSRKVIKDINNPNQKHFYSEDLWTAEGKKLVGLVPENFIVYAELVGWTEGGAPIQTGYTYSLPQGTCKLYIYRVAFVNEKGLVVDLTWDQLKEFCDQRGLSYVREIYRGRHKDFVVEQYLDKQFFTLYSNCLPVDGETVDEGVCIRVDRLTPYILKAKSPKFFEHETALLDKGAEDIENITEEV